MNIKKKLMFIITVLIILMIFIVVIIIYVDNKEKAQLAKEQEEYIYYYDNPGMIINEKKPEEVKATGVYFTVENCVNTYIKYIKENNDKAVYGVLDENFIKSNKISENNSIEKANSNNINDNYRINKMYGLSGLEYSTYYVSGELNSEQIYFIVNLDSNTNAFSIMPIEEHEFTNKINNAIEREQQYEDTIKKNKYNYINYAYYTEAEIVEKYFQDYLENALFNQEIAYSLLDNQYKKNKFENIEEYKKYIQNNREILETMCKSTWRKDTDFSNYVEYEEYYSAILKNGLDKYQIRDVYGDKQYICIDTYGNYYIFNVISIMNYTVLLDTYTIDLPEFTEKYYGAEPTEKVALNIQKVFEALNDKDYKYVYNKLADGFKENYFPTLDDFEQYVKKNFYDENEVEYEYHKKESEEYYSYTIKILDKNSNASKNLKIIMQLQSGTNFVMSFNVN